MAIDPVSTATLALAPSGVTPTPGAAGAADGASFGDSLSDLLGSVDKSAGEANDAVAKMLNGTGDANEAVVAMQKSDLMLQLTVQVRNKLVQAYQDVMRMPV
jgi:flagellar hook-basal body complex protein FliE